MTPDEQWAANLDTPTMVIGRTSDLTILSAQHRAVTARMDAFERAPSLATAHAFLLFAIEHLPGHFHLERVVQLPGCWCHEHAGFLIDAEAALGTPDILARTGALARRIRRHILREERARSDGLSGDEYSVGQGAPYAGGFESCIHIPTDGRVTSGYGMRSSRQTPGEMRMHNGWDLRAARGVPIYSVGDGVVEHVTINGARGFGRYGHVIVIKHPQWQKDGQTVRSMYAHLDSQEVAPGDVVRAGQSIGGAGDTNGSRERPGSRFARGNTHLHFELAARRYPMTSSAGRLDPTVFFRDLGITWEAGRPSEPTSCVGREPFERLSPEESGERAQREAALPHAGVSGLGPLLGFLILAAAFAAFGGR